MIVGEHSVVRAADIDDAALLARLYKPSKPRSFLLGPSRELLLPSRDELADLLARKDMVSGVFFVIEDGQGEIRGCCGLRGGNRSTFTCEAAVMLRDEADYATPLADEVMQFLQTTAFQERQLNKLVAHAIVDAERAYRDYLVRYGFESDGVQRDMVYTLGRYFDLESLSLEREKATALAAPDAPPPGNEEN